MKELWLSEAMIKFNKKFKRGSLNILNAPAGSGKTTFIFKNFLNDTYKYIDNYNKNDKLNLNKILYVCDNNMLKDSVLKNKKNIVKILKAGELKKAMNGITLKDKGKILVITYSTLGKLLNSDASKYIILNKFKFIIFDEFHNLFKYAKRYEDIYIDLINNINVMLKQKNLTLIAMTATPFNLYFKLNKNKITFRTIFDDKELQFIRKYKNLSEVYVGYVSNYLKIMINNKISIENNKYIIYTNTISTADKYKNLLNKYGYKTEWLCSTNAYVDKDKKILKMNNNQIKLRDKLLEDGMLPDDLDVLIINAAYETGWDLRDKRIQTVIIDSTDEEIQIQARNRCRHNIKYLILRANCMPDGAVLERGIFGEVFEKKIGTHIPVVLDYDINLTNNLDDKFIGVKLTKELKKEMIERYGTRKVDKLNNKVTFKSLKEDLKKAGFNLCTTKNGTYILKKDSKIKIESREERKNSMENELKDWLLKEWDKERIACKDVIDNLYISRRSWDNIKRKKSFLNFLKDNKIQMTTIKGAGKSIYFTT